MNIEEVRQIMLKSDITLLKKALDDYNINEFDRFGNNILHLYIKDRKRVSLDYKSVIDLFVSKGLDIDGKRPNTYVFGTALHLAVNMKQKDIFDYLIKLGADINATNTHGNSILNTAVLDYQNGDDGYFVQTLIEKGADIYQKNNYGISPILLAYDFDNKDVKKFFPPLKEK